MIVPMKKAAVIVQSKDAVSAIGKLRSLGVVHVEHQKAPAGKDINPLKAEIGLFTQAIGILSRPEFIAKSRSETGKKRRNWKSTALHIVDLWKRLDQLKEYSRTLKGEIARWEQWGDFNPALIEELFSKGVRVGLYQIPVKAIKNLPSGIIVKRLFTSRGTASCALISRNEIDIPFKPLDLPKIGLNELKKRLEEDARVMQVIREDIHKHVRYSNELLRAVTPLKEELEFQEALNGMGQSETIMYITGYIPHDAAASLSKTAKEEKWGMLISEPSEDDKIPTLVRNPRWVSIISPVFKLIEVIPGYRELDISLWFLIFFSIFFGMLIGDAGYGIIFFGLTAFAHKKWGKKLGDRSIFILFYLLSFCTVVWGALTGTFFGQEWLSGIVAPLMPALRNDRNLQAFCFFLGAVHLSIAHLWRTIIKLPSPKALSDAGWILILWGAYFLARFLVLGDAFPAFGKWLFIAGANAVVIFTNPSKNVLKGLGQGLGNLLMNFVNSFTDIVSYIRLFAVGLASVAVADAFNKMAMEIGFNSILAGVMTSLILLLGHSLNIVLGPMSILVHGVRLNVLEFCSHLDINWSGFAYRPLSEKGKQ